MAHTPASDWIQPATGSGRSKGVVSRSAYSSDPAKPAESATYATSSARPAAANGARTTMAG